MKFAYFFKSSKKIVILLIIFALIAVLIYYLFGSSKGQPLQFASVKRQDIQSSVSSSGTLTGKEIVNLKFKSSGRLAFIKAKPSDKVVANEMVAALDTKLLEIALQQALNTYRDKQALAEKAEDDVKNHDKDETFKQKADRTTAQSARDSAFDEVKAAQKALDDAYLYSPIEGIVTQAQFIVGQNVTSSDLIAQVVDFATPYFDTDIDEADIGQISPGQKAQVTLDAYPDPILEGVVDTVIPQTKTTTSGATVVTVRIKLETAGINFINDLSGQSSIILSGAKNVLTIPLEALSEDDTVFIQTNQGVKIQKIEAGIRSDTDVEVKNGIEEGGLVLLNPPAQGLNGNRGIFGRFFR